MAEISPVVIWPTQNGEYKFMQFTRGEEGFLRFTHARLWHAFIVREFADEVGVETQRERLFTDLVEVFPKDCEYQIIGAGTSNVDLQAKKASFYSSSEGYRIFPNAKHLERLAKKLPDWNLKMGYD